MKVLNAWFMRHQRDLPWRKNPSAYAVWVSEIMLQQTQVSVVLPYFQKWMRLFPTVEALAAASRERVIKAWEGLGYYSRARNLHEGAKYLMQTHQGKLPKTKEELSKVKGIGPYTVGAILSFAFKEKAAAVDGNVMRVITRLFRIESEIERTETKREVEKRVLSLLGPEPWITMEGLIELGALVCKKTPLCEECPLNKQCLGKGLNLPNKKKPPQVTEVTKNIAVILVEGSVLVKKNKEGLMADLFEFPLTEEVQALHLKSLKTLPPLTHSYTRYRATLFPEIFEIEGKVQIELCEWVPLRSVHLLPFSSGHKKILSFLS
jgi:A/G-specific adenine glycosylase